MARLLLRSIESGIGIKCFRILGFLLALTVYQSAQAQTVTVSWGTTYQTIQGFGASNHSYPTGSTTMNSYDSFFFQTLGYSLLRTGTPESSTCNSISSACATSGDSITDMQACVANGCQVWATPWSPPAEYKTNSALPCTSGAGSGALASGSQAAYATFLSNYIASLNQYYSIPLYALSVQNEPSQCMSYDSSLMSASQFDSFIKGNLGPTLSSAGQSGTLIMMPETPGWYNYGSYADTCMNDSACAAYVGINAFHGYDNSTSITNPDNGKQFWETEVSNGSGFGPVASGCTAGTYCPGINDAMMWAGIIDYNIGVVGENSWSYWQYAESASDNESLVNPGQSQPIATRAYVIANWAKFVRPGWVRIGATHAPQTNVTVTAFKNPAGSAYAVVAVNQNSDPVTVEFSLAGFPSVTSVTPTLTSASSNFEDQAIVDISNDTFSYSLPGLSVTTFHGTAAPSGASSPPAPPAGLLAVVN